VSRVSRNVVPRGNLYHTACDYGGYLIFEYYGPSPGVGDTAAVSRPAPRLAVIPSPSAGRVTVEFSVPTPCSAAVRLCDALGRNLGVLHEGRVAPGQSRLEFSTSNLPSGTYFILLEAAGQTQQASFAVTR